MIAIKYISGHLVTICYFLLTFLWVYAVVSKLAAYDRNHEGILNQAISPSLEIMLEWVVSLVELLAAALLLFSKTRLKGIVLSLFLLISFTIYIALVKLYYFYHIPCPCGGLISKLSWEGHFVFNMVFILLAGTVLIMKITENPKTES